MKYNAKENQRIRRFHVQPSISPAIEYRPSITCVITCKGRLTHLQKTLPLLLEQSYPALFEVVVVDYGDPDDCFQWCVRVGHPRLMALRILDNTDRFNLSRARNCGANFRPADLFLFADADSLVHRQFLLAVSQYFKSVNSVLAKRNCHDRNIDTCGLCMVRSEIFHRVRGYDEAFNGWGPEDSDFYSRVGRLGVVISFPVWLYPATISHSNVLRTRFYNEKNLGRSAAKGGQQMARSNRVVNPWGYGRAQALAGLPDGKTLRLDIAEPVSSGSCEATGVM
ncbi:MAG: glycosyltransferase family 2 protein [Phycisphaerae bacterium]